MLCGVTPTHLSAGKDLDKRKGLHTEDVPEVYVALPPCLRRRADFAIRNTRCLCG